MLAKSEDSLDGLMNLLGIKKFDQKDIQFFQEYCHIYKHFAHVLDILQAEKSIFVGALLPVLSGLSKRLEEAEKEVKICGPLAQALIKGINTRFWDDFRNDRLFVAAAVHPRFKTAWIADPERRAEVWQLVRDRLRDIQEGHENTRASATESGPTQSVPAAGDATDSAENPSTAETEVDELDLLVPMGRQDNTADKTLLDVFMSQPTTKHLSTLNSFPLIKELFIKTNTLLPSSAPSEG